MNKLRTIIDAMDQGFLLVMVGIITVFNIGLMTINHVGVFQIILPLLTLLLIFYYTNKYIQKELTFIILLFVFTFLTKSVYTVIIDTQPISDFKLMIDAAQMINAGSRDYLNWQYFVDWSYQIGFVAYEAIILKLTGDSILALKLLNCLYMALTSLLIYGIGKSVFNKSVGRVAGILYGTYLPFIYYGPVLTNQHIATLFYYLFIWLIVKDKTLTMKSGIFAGIALGLGQVFRPLGIVFLLALGLYLIYTKSKEGFKTYLPYLVSLVVFVVVFQLLSGLTGLTGISDNGLSNNDPYWKFVPGLNQEYYGRYNPIDNEMFLSAGSTAERQALEKEIIMDRLKGSPLSMIQFQVLKVGGFWGDFENSIFGLHQFDGKSTSLYYQWYSFEEIFNVLKGMEKVVYTLIFIGVFSMVLMHKRFDKRSKLLLYILSFYMGIHLFIEVSVRYRYEMMGIVILLGSVGLCELWTEINKKRGAIDVK